VAKLLELSLGWFDLVVLVTLLVGLIRGRRRGMSVELLDVFKWLLIVVAGARFYRPLGDTLTVYTHVAGLLAYLTAYIMILLLVTLLFAAVKRLIGEKLLGSDVFGNLEYYFGMAAGMLRYACVLVVVLALLHAPYISEEKLKAIAKMQQDNFGSISFPTFGSIQQEVFAHSICGKLVDDHLDSQLIAKTAYVGFGLASGDDRLAKRKERAIDEILSGGAAR
jgi:uncharacterized membrane protein required for colicin V production